MFLLYSKKKSTVFYACICNIISLNKLIETLKLAKSKYGFRVQLDLWARGIEDPSNPYSGDHIEEVDNRITDDWNKLLSNPETAFWMGRTVDIFNVISEPTLNIQGQNHPSFFDPVLRDTGELIRNRINNPNAIIGYSAGRWCWAGDADELLGHNRSELDPEITINIHPSRLDFISEDTRSDPRKCAKELQQEGFNISVGEFGWRDWNLNREYVEDALRYFEEHKISYAVVGAIGGYAYMPSRGPDDGELFMDYYGQVLSPYGEYLKNFWSKLGDK